MGQHKEFGMELEGYRKPVDNGIKREGSRGLEGGKDLFYGLFFMSTPVLTNGLVYVTG